MSSHGSVSQWIDEIKIGDDAAAQKLWEAYFQKLVGLARNRLGKTPRRAADEEDVALSAFNSFFQGVARGRFPQLNDRTDLWRVLVRITACKTVDQINHDRRRKRRPTGAAQVQGESAFEALGGEGGIAQVIGDEPTPAFAAQVAEEYRRRLNSLDNPDYRQVVEWKMEGYSNDEIADKLGCVVRSVKRKLQLIRSVWKSEGEK
jgi:DNA-directed RNA polymerase specialized sigma24 family protein